MPVVPERIGPMTSLCGAPGSFVMALASALTRLYPHLFRPLPTHHDVLIRRREWARHRRWLQA